MLVLLNFSFFAFDGTMSMKLCDVPFNFFLILISHGNVTMRSGPAQGKIEWIYSTWPSPGQMNLGMTRMC